jgi:hypothetical protein
VSLRGGPLHIFQRVKGTVATWSTKVEEDTDWKKILDNISALLPSYEALVIKTWHARKDIGAFSPEWLAASQPYAGNFAAKCKRQQEKMLEARTGLKVLSDILNKWTMSSPDERASMTTEELREASARLSSLTQELNELQHWKSETFQQAQAKDPAHYQATPPQTG